VKRKRIKKAKRVLDERPIYCVYYIRREDKVDTYDENLWGVFYVGKGNDRRVYFHRKHVLRTVGKGKHRRLVYKLMDRFYVDGIAFIEEIMFTGLTEWEAFEIEMSAIAAYGRIDNGTGCLANHTDGGEGTSGYVLSEEERQKRKDRVFTKEWRENLSKSRIGDKNHRFGKHWSEADRKRIGESEKGKKESDETKQKKREAMLGDKNPMYGKPQSEAHRKKNSEGHMGQPAWNKGVPMRESQKQYLKNVRRIKFTNKVYIRDIVNRMVQIGDDYGEE